MHLKRNIDELMKKFNTPVCPLLNTYGMYSGVNPCELMMITYALMINSRRRTLQKSPTSFALGRQIRGQRLLQT